MIPPIPLRRNSSAIMAFSVIVLASLTVGANTGYTADTAADAQIDVEKATAGQFDGGDGPIERGLLGIAEQTTRQSLMLADHAATWTYHNQGWFKAIYAKSLLNLGALGILVYGFHDAYTTFRGVRA